MNPGRRVLRDRVAMPDADDARLERRNPLQGRTVLLLIEIEPRSARVQLRPRRDGIARDQELPLRPVEREMPRGMAYGVQHLQRAERVALGERLVDGTRNVLRPAEPQAELKGEQPQRLLRHERDRLR